MFRTVWSYIGENKLLKAKVKELEVKVLLSESQNYCKMCGNILDGYVPPKKETEGLE